MLRDAADVCRKKLVLKNDDCRRTRLKRRFVAIRFLSVRLMAVLFRAIPLFLIAMILQIPPTALSQVSVPVEALYVESSLDPSSIKEHVAWWSTGNRELPPFSVYERIDNFQPMLGKSLIVEQTPAILWLYFALDSELSHDLVLEFLEPNIEVVTIFKITRSFEDQIWIHAEETRGLRYQDFKNESDSPNHHFHLKLEPSAHQGYLVRIYIEQPRLIDMKLWQETDFLKAGRQLALQQGVISGISVFMVLLAVVLWLVIRSHDYLGYVGFGVSTATLQLILSGFALVWLWPDSPHWRTVVEVFALLGMTVSLIPLLSLFVESWSRRVKTVSLLVASLMGLTLLASLLLPSSIRQVFLVVYVSALGIMGVCILVANMKAIKMSWPLLFLIAWCSAVLVILAEFMQESPLFLLTGDYEPHLFLIVSQALMFFAILINFVERIRYRADHNLEEVQSLMVQKEALIKESKVKNNFLGLISQELRSPLIGVIGGVDLMKSTDLTPKQRQHWDMVSQSAEQLHSLVSELLNFTEMQTQGITLKKEEIDFSELLTKLSKKYQTLCEQKSVEWSVVQDKGVPEYIISDADRLTQLIDHLLDNALKYTFYGKIELRIRIPRAAISASIVQLGIEVVDTGIGIPADRKAYLFDPYMLSEQMDRRQFGGLGLGLSYCKQLCDLMGGRIELDSQSGQGTKVTAWIMVEQMEDAQQESALALYSDRGLGDLEILQVLLVEDNLVNQIVMTGLLSKMNLTSHCADNGEQALELLRNSAQEQALTFDIILMDCQMPIMDGYATTQAIRASSEYYSQLPIIAVTANATPEAKAHCLEAGMNDYITKPFGLELLEKKLKPWVERLVNPKPRILKNVSGDV
jgi:signal transduction histidine kinase/ActR/RegA family two-component response regulator